MACFDPGLRDGYGDLGGGHLGQAGEDVAQVGERVEAPAAAAASLRSPIGLPVTGYLRFASVR